MSKKSVGLRFTGASWFLLIGDVIILGLFSYIGRAEHQEGLALLAVLETAAPFLLAWILVGGLLRGFHLDKYTDLTSTVKWTLLLGVVGISLGLVFRAIWLQRGVPISFAVITYLFNLALLLVWRLLFSWRLRRKLSEKLA